MAHLYSKEAEEVLDKEFKVLDKGFVRLIDYMGNDSRIVQSARVSYGAGTKTVSEDKGLINYLLKNQHMTPFEKVRFEFHVKLPIFIARQWIRHRMGSFNELSGRYSVLKNEAYLPQLDRLCIQSTNNKQGSGETLPPEIANKLQFLFNQEQGRAFEMYEDFLEEGLARELARINLPLSTYTEWYWTVDLRNLFNFLYLRFDGHAQWEIQEYSKVVADMTKAVCPLAYDAFENHVKNAVKFSGEEIKVLQVLAVVNWFTEAKVKYAEEQLGVKKAKEFLDKLGIVK